MGFETTHHIYFQNAASMEKISSESIDLIVTSPPYPMIEMWDRTFFSLNPQIEGALRKGAGLAAFELMHLELDKIWRETYRVLKPGRFACINIGDATRTIDGEFMLYPNHVRFLSQLLKLGFTPLPEILWRKQTNAPNKFMGSGMLPAGAYVTLEHEFILIVRKGGKREFTHKDDKETRRTSALFWEERNNWFSDVWMDIKGARQELGGNAALHRRSAAYPFEIPYRLINMYTVKQDTVLDPFLGTGTTMYAAMVAGRNSVGYEIEPHLKRSIVEPVADIPKFANPLIDNRIRKHIEFIEKRFEIKGPFKHENSRYHFPVITAQEKELLINPVDSVQKIEENHFMVKYAKLPRQAFSDAYKHMLQKEPEKGEAPPRRPKRRKPKKVMKKETVKQMELFN